MSEELFGQCDECSSQSILYNAIVDGKTKKLCKHCLNSSNAIEIKKPKKISIQTGRPSVKEILMKMSGLDKGKEKNEVPNLKEGLSKQPGEITLNDLIERKWQMKKEGKTEREKETENEEKTEETEETKTAESAVNAEEKPQHAIKQLDPSEPLDFSIKTTKNISIGDLLKLKEHKGQQEQERAK